MGDQAEPFPVKASKESVENMSNKEVGAMLPSEN